MSAWELKPDGKVFSGDGFHVATVIGRKNNLDRFTSNSKMIKHAPEVIMFLKYFNLAMLSKKIGGEDFNGRIEQLDKECKRLLKEIT